MVRQRAHFWCRQERPGVGERVDQREQRSGNGIRKRRSRRRLRNAARRSKPRACAARCARARRVHSGRRNSTQRWHANAARRSVAAVSQTASAACAPMCSDSRLESTSPSLGAILCARPNRSHECDAAPNAASARMPHVASCCSDLRATDSCESIRKPVASLWLRTHLSSLCALRSSLSAPGAMFPSATAAACAASTGTSAAFTRALHDAPVSSANSVWRRAQSFSATKHKSSKAKCCTPRKTRTLHEC